MFMGYNHYSRNLCLCRRKSSSIALLECPGCRNKICAPCHIGLVARKWKNGYKCCRKIRATEEFAMGILLNMSEFYEKAQEILGEGPIDSSITYKNFCRCSDDSVALKCSKGHKICYSCRAGFTKSEYHENCSECMKAVVSKEELQKCVIWLEKNEPAEIIGKYRVDQLPREEGSLFPMIPIEAVMKAADALDGVKDLQNLTVYADKLLGLLETYQESAESKTLTKIQTSLLKITGKLYWLKQSRRNLFRVLPLQSHQLPWSRNLATKEFLLSIRLVSNGYTKLQIVKRELFRSYLGAKKANLIKVTKPPNNEDGRRLAGIAVPKVEEKKNKLDLLSKLGKLDQMEEDVYQEVNTRPQTFFNEDNKENEVSSF